MFSIKLWWILFWLLAMMLSRGRKMRFARPLEAEDAGCLTSTGGVLTGECTGNEIWIDQIYLLSVHFNKVRYQRGGVPSNGRLPQVHSVRNGPCHRSRWRKIIHWSQGLSVLMGVKEYGLCEWRSGWSWQSVKQSSIDLFAFHKLIVLWCSWVAK